MRRSHEKSRPYGRLYQFVGCDCCQFSFSISAAALSISPIAASSSSLDVMICAVDATASDAALARSSLTIAASAALILAVACCSRCLMASSAAFSAFSECARLSLLLSSGSTLPLLPLRDADAGTGEARREPPAHVPHQDRNGSFLTVRQECQQVPILPSSRQGSQRSQSQRQPR